MWPWILAGVLIVGGAAAYFISFDGAMIDGPEPSWGGPLAYGGFAAVTIGIGISISICLGLGLNFWER